MQYTPPADAEYLYYGYCKSITTIPMTPNGVPTPALLTKTALEASSIPHITINAGSTISPQLPFIHTGIAHGHDISVKNAMSEMTVVKAIDYGRIVGRNMASLTDCLVIGESIPGGTTTALAVLRAMGFDAKTSSSMPSNPVDLKDKIVSQALARVDSDVSYRIVAQVGDPMIPFVAGMLGSASETSNVILAGGTQMAAVLAFASKVGFNVENVIVGTTSYVTDDSSANFAELIKSISDVPAIAINPHMDRSIYSGLNAFSKGFGKEGVGAGGAIISSILKSEMNISQFLTLAEHEYNRLTTSSTTTTT